MMNHTNILIVGAGQAAGQLLITLKQNKFSGKITLIGDEAVSYTHLTLPTKA